MTKYYVFLILIVGTALFYAFLSDPCNRRLKTDFSNMYPGYKIVDTGASEGSRESVRCHISYQKPDSEQIYEDIWLYRHSGSGWKFSRILETPKSGEGPLSEPEKPS